MRMTTFVRGLGLAAALAVGGCKSLDITNPNDPDAERALSDPAALEGLVGGSVQGWFNTFEGLEGTGPLVTQAQTYSSSWNTFNMDFYSGLDLDGTRNSRSWQNNPAAAQRTSIVQSKRNQGRAGAAAVEFIVDPSNGLAVRRRTYLASARGPPLHP